MKKAVDMCEFSGMLPPTADGEIAMPSKPTNFENLSVTLTEDGTATLTGINYDDLRSLLTAASLHAYDDPAKAEPLSGFMDDVVHQNNLEAFAWHLKQQLIVDVVSAKLAQAISPEYTKDVVPGFLKYHALELRDLENTVHEAETKAAEIEANKQPDLLAEAAQAMTKALREADSALAKLNQAHEAVRRASGE